MTENQLQDEKIEVEVVRDETRSVENFDGHRLSPEDIERALTSAEAAHFVQDKTTEYKIHSGDPVEVVTKIPVEGMEGVSFVETVNVANQGDIIATGPLGEEFVKKPGKVAIPNGKSEPGSEFTLREEGKEVFAVSVGDFFGTDKPIVIKAPWGEDQVALDGGFLVAGVGSDGKPDLSDAYLVASSAFMVTYKAEQTRSPQRPSPGQTR